jgi:hypothetical protein
MLSIFFTDSFLTGFTGGRKNVIPGAIVFSLFGATAQIVYNIADAKNAEAAKLAPESKQRSWLDSKWSPVKILTDEEYESMLREKLLRINAQIAILDENIGALREEQEVTKEVDKAVPASKFQKSSYQGRA